jgi:hypothetical protein
VLYTQFRARRARAEDTLAARHPTTDHGGEQRVTTSARASHLAKPRGGRGADLLNWVARFRSERSVERMPRAAQKAENRVCACWPACARYDACVCGRDKMLLLQILSYMRERPIHGEPDAKRRTRWKRWRRSERVRSAAEPTGPSSFFQLPSYVISPGKQKRMFCTTSSGLCMGDEPDGRGQHHIHHKPCGIHQLSPPKGRHRPPFCFLTHVTARLHIPRMMMKPNQILFYIFTSPQGKKRYNTI